MLPLNMPPPWAARLKVSLSPVLEVSVTEQQGLPLRSRSPTVTVAEVPISYADREKATVPFDDTGTKSGTSLLATGVPMPVTSS